MDRITLIRKLKELNIFSISYSLGGTELFDLSLVMKKYTLPSRYEVYTFERGTRYSHNYFNSKEEAYLYIFNYFFELEDGTPRSLVVKCIKFKSKFNSNEFIIEECLDECGSSLSVYSNKKISYKYTFDDIESCMNFAEEKYNIKAQGSWDYVT